MSVMRAKLRVSAVTANESSEEISFSAVARNDNYPADGSDENNTYAMWTPTADLNMVINNPALFVGFYEGQEFYVDFTPAK